VENNVKLAPDKTLSTWVGGAQRHRYSYIDVVFKFSNEYSFSMKTSAMSLQSRLMMKKREEKLFSLTWPLLRVTAALVPLAVMTCTEVHMVCPGTAT
jgi:hypothetical protein